MLIGITLEGVKEVIDYRLYPTESAEHYEEMLRDVRARGAEEVLMVVTDSLSGIKEAVGRVYPRALHQACWVHIERNAAGNVRSCDKKDVEDALKAFYCYYSDFNARFEDRTMQGFAKCHNELVEMFERVYGDLETEGFAEIPRLLPEAFPENFSGETTG